MRGLLLKNFLLATIGAAVLAVAPVAKAHIQVLPGEVAPADPALFTVLVPGETASGTSKVALKVPAGVYPFSYEETPGWKRRLIKKQNGMVDQIIWTGKAEPDGLVQFTFLAGTPEKTGSIKWAAIQTYADGEEARWIGDPESEHPAPVTLVSDTAPRQNAGGEAAAADSSGSDPSSPAAESSGDENSLPLTIAALLGFFFGLSSLVILLLNKRRPGPG